MFISQLFLRLSLSKEEETIMLFSLLLLLLVPLDLLMISQLEIKLSGLNETAETKLIEIAL